MIRRTSLILAMFIISGCAPTANLASPTQMPMTEPIVVIPTLQQSATPTMSGNQALAPTSVLASPTVIPKAAVLPTATAPSGWKTYVNAKLQVVIDYAPDWSVREQAAGVIFTSPQGDEILLAPVETASLSPEEFSIQSDLPNTRCSSSVNSHGVVARICFDTISFSYTASLIVKPAGGTERLLSLSTRARESQPVFNAMVASVRPTS